jgi:hypothetical protein
MGQKFIPKRKDDEEEKENTERDGLNYDERLG